MEFSFSISLISFRMDWLDLVAVQGTLKSLLQHHSSKASILWRSAFFTVQLSHSYMTTGKTIVLTRWTFVTFVGKVMSLLLNMLSRLVITSLLWDPVDCSPPGSSVHGILQARLLEWVGSVAPWDSPGKPTGVGCYFLLQGIFPTQGLNPGLPHCRQTL